MYKVYSGKHGDRWFEAKSFEGEIAEFESIYDAQEFAEYGTSENEKYHHKIVNMETGQVEGYYTRLYDNFMINHKDIPLDDIRESYKVSKEDWLVALEKWIADYKAKTQNVLGE